MMANDKRIVWVIASLFLASTALGKNDLTVRWGHQNMTPSKDGVLGACVDSHNGFCVTGFMKSPDAGPGVMAPPNARSHSDAFVVKYDAQGVLQWSRKLGGPETDRAEGVAVDGQDNVYVFGFTHGTIGQESQGLIDAFVAKYDAAGTSLWIWQLGTPTTHSISTQTIGRFGGSLITIRPAEPIWTSGQK